MNTVLVAVLPDPSALSGHSLVALITDVLQDHVTKRSWTVTVRGVEGARVPECLLKSGSHFALSDFLEVREGVIQFDWGEFYLTDKDVEQHPAMANLDSNPLALMLNYRLFIYAVDDTYFYCLTQDPDIANCLRASKSHWESIGESDLSTLEIPY